MKTALTLTALTFTASLMATSLAYAAGGGNSGSSQQCNRGWTWDQSQRRCVRNNSALDNESIYQAGRMHAEAGDYDQAIEVLMIGADRGDKRILNYLGFAHRKAGRIDVGLGYYQKAIEIDPEYTLVREYMGEALLQKGDLEGALDQLAEIRRLCQSRDCGEYRELSGQIADYIKNQDS